MMIQEIIIELAIRGIEIWKDGAVMRYRCRGPLPPKTANWIKERLSTLLVIYGPKTPFPRTVCACILIASEENAERRKLLAEILRERGETFEAVEAVFDQILKWEFAYRGAA